MTTVAQIRKIDSITEYITTERVDHTEKKTLRDWLQSKMTDTSYLLAHADDGVIWGHLVDKQLVIARDVAEELADDDQKRRLLAVCPSLDWSTLWEARVFDENEMYHLWQSGEDWICTHYTNDTNKKNDAQAIFNDVIDEEQLTWGTPNRRYELEGFTVMRDGQQGLVHVVPLKVKDNHRLWLRVRHYVKEDDNTGFNHITASRLLGLEPKGENDNG